MKIFNWDTAEQRYPLFVAEISCNHCGKLENVFKLMDAAKRAYVDIIKIQVYTPDELTLNSSNEDFIIKKGLWKGKNLYELYNSTHTHPDLAQPIFDYAKHIDIPIFASVFGMHGLEKLERINCKAYKIASFEFNDTLLVDQVLNTKKPVIFSTGMATDYEIDTLLQKLKFNFMRSDDYMLMHCVSKYPCKLDDASLYRIKRLADSVGINGVGYSDHTKGNAAAGLAAVLGAKIIEKHFYNPLLGKSEDSAFSMSPAMFKRMVGHVRFMVDACEEKKPRGIEAALQFKRSLYVSKDIKAGQVFSEKNIKSVRPSYGLEPYLLKDVLKSKAKCDIQAGTALRGDMVDWK